MMQIIQEALPLRGWTVFIHLLYHFWQAAI